MYSDLSPTKSVPSFQQQQFWEQSAHEETGLEGIMEKAFRIDEVPSEVKEIHGRDVAVAMVVEREELMKKKIIKRSFIAVVGIAMLGVAIAVGSGDEPGVVEARRLVGAVFRETGKGLSDLVGF